MPSISFDRAAGYYDATRGLPQRATDDLAGMLAAEIGAGRCLEIGVGTGRIALPLHHRGVRLVGADLSAPMLGRLKDNAGGDSPFPILLADATRLPFRQASYDALIAGHVFHLIPDWRAAADEALRVVRPGGALLIDFGGGVNPPWLRLLEEAFDAQGITRVRPGVSDSGEFADYCGDRVEKRALPPITVITSHALGRDLDLIERQVASWSWAYPPELMRAAAADARGRAEKEGFDLQAEVELPYVMQWWAYDVAIGIARKDYTE